MLIEALDAYNSHCDREGRAEMMLDSLKLSFAESPPASQEEYSAKLGSILSSVRNVSDDTAKKRKMRLEKTAALVTRLVQIRDSQKTI